MVVLEAVLRYGSNYCRVEPSVGSYPVSRRLSVATLFHIMSGWLRFRKPITYYDITIYKIYNFFIIIYFQLKFLIYLKKFWKIFIKNFWSQSIFKFIFKNT